MMIEIYFIMIIMTIIWIFMPIIFILNTGVQAFCSKVVLVLQMRTSLDVSTPGHSLWILDWTYYLRTHLWHVKILYYDILQGSSRLCNWFPLRRLVTWINHLPPVCWSTCFKSSLNWWWVCKFDTTISLFSIMFYIYFMPQGMIFYFRLSCFHVSNSALFFT